MTTRIHGRVALRLSICSHRTLEEDIEMTFAAITDAGRRLATQFGTTAGYRDN
jgi:hypothetical protein